MESFALLSNPENVASSDLQFFSEWCWKDAPGQLPNADFHNKIYSILQYRGKAGKEFKRTHRLHLEAPREHAKTTCVSVKYVLWRIGRNPNLRVVVISRTGALAQDINREVRRNIENNTRYHGVFPKVIPDAPWGDEKFQVKRSAIMKSPTFYGCGLEGSVTGIRGDLLILDDPFDLNEIRTPASREKVRNWIDSVTISILPPDGELIGVGCLVAGTKVLMANGSWKNIEDILVGEKVFSYNSIETVEAMIPQGIADVYELKTKNHTIEATSNHPFLTLRDGVYSFIKLEDLTTEDKIVSFQFKEDGVNPKNLTSEDLWILGFMFGDGWITHNPDKTYNSMRWITCVSKGVYEWKNNRILKYFKEKFNCVPKLTKGRYYRFDVAKIGRWFEKLGFKGTSKTKRIPKYVFELPLELRRSFIDGIIAADGHINKNKTRSIELTNGKLIKDLKLLAMISGYRSNNIYERTRIQQPPNSPKPVKSHTSHISIGFKEFNKRFRLVEVMSIKHIGKKPVYDLTISNTKNFVAEGLVVHNTRWHEDDYWGNLLLKSTDKGGDWVCKVYRAIENYDDPIEKWKVLWPERWSAQALAKRRRDVGSLMFKSLYQNDPTGLEGALFQSEWLSYYDPTYFSMIHPRNFEFVMGVDPAISEDPKADRTAITTIARDLRNSDVYVLDVWADRVDFPSQVRKIVEYAHRSSVPGIPFPKPIHIRKVGIESVAYQRALYASIYDKGLPVVEVKNRRQSKLERMLGLQPNFENGRIKLPRGFHPNWMDKFMGEYLNYPRGQHDDILDSLEIAVSLTQPVLGQSSMGVWMGRQPGGEAFPRIFKGSRPF